LLARPACGWGGLRDRCRVSSSRTARVHPARPAKRILTNVATGEQYDRLMIAQVSSSSARGVGVTGRPCRHLWQEE
jgi:hypothetical protein